MSWNHYVGCEPISGASPLIVHFILNILYLENCWRSLFLTGYYAYALNDSQWCLLLGKYGKDCSV